MHGVNATKKLNEEWAERELQKRKWCNCPCCAKKRKSESKEEEDEG